MMKLVSSQGFKAGSKYEGNNNNNNKGIQIGFFLFADDITINLKDPKNSPRKISDLISTFSKETGYKNQKLFYTPTINFP